MLRLAIFSLSCSSPRFSDVADDDDDDYILTYIKSYVWVKTCQNKPY